MNQVLAPEKSLAASIGNLLQTARLSRGLSLEDIAQRTFIKLHYLQALEQEQFESLPAPVYTSGYIRQVARLLGLDDAPLIQNYQQNRQQASDSAAVDVLAGAVFPVLTQKDGRRIEAVRLPNPQPAPAATLQAQPAPSAQPAQSGETAQAMEPMTLASQTAAPQKQVIETIEGARKEALAMRHQTEQFADQVLLHLEQEIQKTLGIVRNGRTYLQKRLDGYQF